MITEENFEEEFEKDILRIHGLSENHIDKLAKLRLDYIRGKFNNAEDESQDGAGQ